MTISQTAPQAGTNIDPTYVSPVRAAKYLGLTPFAVRELCAIDRLASTRWSGVLWVETASLREAAPRFGVPAEREL